MGCLTQITVNLEIAVEGAHTADHACHGTGGNAGFEKVLHVVFEQGQIDIERINVARAGIVEKTAQSHGRKPHGCWQKDLAQGGGMFVVLEQFWCSSTGFTSFGQRGLHTSSRFRILRAMYEE